MNYKDRLAQGEIDMLSNAKYNCQTNGSNEFVENNPLTSVVAEHKTAANAPHFDQAGRAKRRPSRNRQFSQNTGLASAGWRVTSW